MTTSLSLLFLLLSVLLLSSSVNAQNFNPRRGRDRNRRTLAPGTSVFNKANNTRCNRKYRTFDGTCTNDIYRLAGASGTASFSYNRFLSSAVPVGRGLPSARKLSNILCSQSGNVFSKRQLSEFVVFFGQFVDHTIVASSSDKTPFNIPIERSDPVFANFSSGYLPFTRNKRIEPVPQDRRRTRTVGVQRPVNLLPSPLDLASVYGPNENRIKFLRKFVDGLLLTSSGNMLPFNNFALSNAPDTSRNFFLAGDHRANEHPTLLAFHTLFVREHNYIARALKKAFPTWNDGKLFFEARRINIAQFQKIVYEEFLPSILGGQIRRSKGYRKNALPIVSVEFSTAGFRVGHTMVGNEVTRRGPGLSYLTPVPMSRAFFPTGSYILQQGIEPFLRGAFSTRSQEIDLQVHDMLRNFLFTAVRGEEGLDLIALNIQRGRDHALPTYNELRQTLTGKKARSFRDVTRNIAVQNKLQAAYGSVDKVEAWIGLVAEDHAPGASVGRTMKALWTEEFARLRDGDRLFYATNRRLFNRRLRQGIPGIVNDMLYGRDLMKKILLRNTPISSREIGASVWRA